MAKQGSGVLRIYGDVGLRLDETQALMAAIDHAYNCLWTLDDVLYALSEYRREPPFFWSPIDGLRRFRRLSPEAGWPLSPSVVATLVPPAHRLRLNGASFSSPGFWEFLGKLNPLEVLRQYLQDRHERRKDRLYREQAERRRLDLENERLRLENNVLENQVFHQKLEIARSVGFREEDLAPYINTFLSEPLRKLERYQDQEIIDTAEIVEPEGPQRRR